MSPRRLRYQGVPVSDDLAMATGAVLALILAGAILTYPWDPLRSFWHV